VPALLEFASRFQSETGIQCSVEAPGVGRLPAHLETALYRIAQEGLANVRKHADASNAGVLLGASSDVITLIVGDDGRGFDVETYVKNRPTTSFGLAGMRERVELVGGALTVRSAPSKGTQIRVTVPFSPPLEGAE